MRPFIRTLRRDRRGLGVLEFAIILPAMLTLICGTIELGHMILARQVLEGAVVEAARKATASMETGQVQRTAIMRASIMASMRDFPTAPGQTISINTAVYADFSSAFPETFTDTNNNGAWNTGEPYVDRNRNGRWDNTTPKPGTLGGPGDVVSYTVHFPKKILFSFITRAFGAGTTSLPLVGTTVMRNEAVVQRL